MDIRSIKEDVRQKIKDKQRIAITPDSHDIELQPSDLNQLITEFQSIDNLNRYQEGLVDHSIKVQLHIFRNLLIAAILIAFYFSLKGGML